MGVLGVMRLVCFALLESGGALCSPAWSRLANPFETERQDAPLRLIRSAIVSL